MRPLIFCFLCLMPGIASSDMLLDLRFASGAPKAQIVASGDTVFVDLILSESGANTAIFDQGLSSGGGSVFQTGFGGAIVTKNNTAVPNPAFVPGVPAMVTLPPGSIDAILMFGFPTVGSMTSIVTIATFEFIATGAPGTTATLTANVYDPSLVTVANATPLGGLAGNLDAILTNLATTPANFGSVSLTIGAAAVPEPSTMLVGCLVVGGGLFWKRRKAKVACDT